MTAAMVAQYAMWGACVCYLVAGGAYLHENQTWTAMTTLLYAASVITVWMAGTK
jgi:hypothetical protein